MWKRMIASLAMALAMGSAAQASVLLNLFPWQAEGAGNWTLGTSDFIVTQTRNDSPTVFHTGTMDRGKSFEGVASVNATLDDDFFGFVLGYTSGDLGNSNADYLLLDWKSSDQNIFGGTARAGLALSRVTGPLGDRGAWLHEPADNVTEIARGETFGNVGWRNFTQYRFRLAFTEDLVEIFVGPQDFGLPTTPEISISAAMAGGPFSNGSFGFYSFSQETVSFNAFTETVPTPIPAPAAFVLLASALGVTAVARRCQRAARSRHG